MPNYIDQQYQVYTPSGVTDSLDGNTARQGAMTLLQNMIPDPETAGLFVCRAAAYALTTFGGFIAPGYVSLQKDFGNLVVGFIATGRNAGHDEPFIFNRSTGAFVTIAGVTAGSTPTSPATTGAWTPPTVDAVGAYFVFTHPGFSGSNFIGLITLSGTTYTWSAGNTTTTGLPGVPVSVTVFNDRAYYSVNNQLWFSDVLVPGTITNATQFLTLGDAAPIVATSGQPFFTTQTGGILAALIALKNSQIWQVTGDAATSNLLLNKLSDGVGTAAPRSLANTPLGVMFVAADGVRTITQTGQVSEANTDLSLPFMNPVVPSRIAAAYNVGFYRICTNFLQGGVLQTLEYWFSTKRSSWCGPHTLTYDCVTSADSTFFTTGPNYPAQVLQTNVIPSEQTDFYTELGRQLTFSYQTALVPEFRAMPGWTLVESSLFMGFQLQQSVACEILDQSYNVLGTATLTTPFLAPTNPTNWKLSFTAPGGGATINIPSRHMFQITGTSTMNLAIGSVFAHYQYQPNNNALDMAALSTIPASMDWGSVADPIINYNLDWGAITDATLANVDFGVLP